MKIYLDICALKRPFDDQTQPRIRTETTAVLAILDAVASGQLEAIRSSAHDLENAQNPDTRRARNVQSWLDGLGPARAAPGSVRDRTIALETQGFAAVDALHLAWAEHLGAERFITTDDRLASQAGRSSAAMRVRVVDPVAFVREVLR